VLLLDLLEAGEEPGALAAGDRDLGGLEASPQLRARGVDDRPRQNPAGDRRQDGILNEVGGAASGVATEDGTAVVAALGTALDVRLPPHPRTTRTVEQAA